MSLKRKISARVQAIKGRVTQRFGGATRNRRLETEGRTDQVMGNLKLFGEKAKDIFKR
ncbi:CsbD family protein [Nonomuraea sp. NPDC049152]|uniref:CsbD family protein n=1 Tax=Nonomuraea sp. NPDC049152 TaxID=3154350 RepID=UPI00340C2696